MSLSRRNLLKTAGGGSLVSLMPGLNVAFGDDAAQGNQILVFLFLRFGMDGLSLVAPSDTAAYRDARPTIAVPTSGFGAGLHLGDHEGVPFFMHPAAIQLYYMFKNKSLAVIHASGVPTENRSHFETQEMVTRGIADNELVQPQGWLARHLLTRSEARGDFDAVSDGQGVTSTLDGLGGSLSFENLANLGGSLYGNYAAAIEAMHTGTNDLDLSVQKAVRVAQIVRERTMSLPPVIGQGNYTYGPLSSRLRPLAQVLKLDVGVQIATADFIGWDHHEYQSNAFPRQAQELGDALFAFTDDLGAMANRVTIVMMTEFGRRVRENTNNGTDHGAGSVMLVQGAGVNGGKFYGQWPGLTPSVLNAGDLPVVTDYRRVLGELLVTRQGQTKMDQVFPGVNLAQLGVFSQA